LSGRERKERKGKKKKKKKREGRGRDASNCNLDLMVGYEELYGKREAVINLKASISLKFKAVIL
jgi:hypothetical protein